MSVKVEVSLALVSIALCSGLILARPNTRTSPAHPPLLTVTRVAKVPIDTAKAWDESVAEHCLETARGQSG